jgi:hypothetical protein
VRWRPWAAGTLSKGRVCGGGVRGGSGTYGAVGHQRWGRAGEEVVQCAAWVPRTTQEAMSTGAVSKGQIRGSLVEGFRVEVVR